MFTYRLFSAIGLAVGLIPRRISYPLAAIGGHLFFLVSRQQARNATENMKRVLGPRATRRDARKLAIRSFQQYSKFLVDFMRFPFLQRADLERIPTFGWEHLDAALSGGKGAIIVTTHFGNWDMAAAILGASPYPCNALVDTLKPAAFDKIVQETREKHGLNLIRVEGALTSIFRALRRNEVILIVADKPSPGSGVLVEFFGEKTWLPEGPAAIALKTGAKIVPAFLARQPNDLDFWGRLEPAVEYELSGNKEQDIQTITQCVARALEEVIRRYPDQWYMFRPMWSNESGDIS
ncbi:MAG: lysophospholipid acyltransferase family protein [Chloroflexi bacterium]|nr:lysophospholipid acyltransferase family protein [Chloroflexota bacterium]